MFAAFLTVHPLGPLVITGSEDHSVIIYHLNGQEVDFCVLPAPEKSRLSSPCPQTSLYGGQHTFPEAWLAKPNGSVMWLQLVQVLPGRSDPAAPGDGHCDKVLAVDAHPTKAQLASGGLSKDCTIRIWEDTACC